MTASPGLLPGTALRAAWAAAAAHLKSCAKAVDAINVYPVPDGDTGSNMAATLAEAVDAARLVEPPVPVDAVLAALAKGALYGARGNSGVILSQALKGLATGAGQGDAFDAAMLAAGLQEAARGAYAAVGKPQEGTMLTVLRMAATEAVAAAAGLPSGGRGASCIGVLARVVVAAEEAEAHTIEQLPALAEAGVTDAGGEGICVILRGLLAALRGEAPAAPALPARPIAMMAGHRDEFGFCTEFLLEADGAPIDIERVRALAGGGANTSVVVVGDERAIHVHVHTGEPQRLLDAVAAFGRVGRAKMEDMTAQNVRWQETGSGAGARVAILALSRGEGFDLIFRSLGAHVLDLGNIIKPPAGEIAEAADSIGAADVIILPNHKNVVLAAEQAASLSRATLRVTPTESLVEGIAAALAFDREEDAATNRDAMDEARRSVRTVEVTMAAADRTANGVAVHAGDAIAFLDGTLVAARATPSQALLAGLEAGGAGAAGLLTIYAGAEAPLAAEAVAVELREAFPGVEVQGVSGGQPLYVYIASIEA